MESVFRKLCTISVKQDEIIKRITNLESKIQSPISTTDTNIISKITNEVEYDSFVHTQLNQNNTRQKIVC